MNTQTEHQSASRFQFSVILRFVIAFLLLVQSSWSQVAGPQDPAAVQRVGVTPGNQLRLTLDNAIALALTNSNDVEASRDELRMSQFSCTASLGVFDVHLSPETYFRRTVSPVASSLSGVANGSLRQQDRRSAIRLNGSTNSGGSYDVDFSANRITTNNQFVSLSPQYPTSLNFTYTQPLMRGLRIDDNRRQIQVAKKNVAMNDAQFQQRVMEIITDVTRAFWDLVFAVQNEQVQVEARNQAQGQLESNRRQAEQGVLAPIDVVAAEAQMAVFEQDIYTAQETITRAENALKVLLLPDRRAPEWSRPLQPVTEANPQPPSVDLSEAVSAALENRPELQRAKAVADINEINTRYFRDQSKPQVDVVGTYTSAGLAGTAAAVRSVNPLAGGFEPIVARLNELSTQAGLTTIPSLNFGNGAVPEVFIGGMSESLRSLFNSRFPTTEVGLRINLPLRNRTAEGNLGRSLAEASRIKDQNEQLEQQIEAEVRNAVQAIRSAQARSTAAAAARSAAQQLFESEQRRLQTGASTVFLVFQRQTDLITARSRELQAQTDLNKAIATFQRVTGNTFKANNVTLRAEVAGSRSCQPAQ